MDAERQFGRSPPSPYTSAARFQSQGNSHLSLMSSLQRDCRISAFSCCCPKYPEVLMYLPSKTICSAAFGTHTSEPAA